MPQTPTAPDTDFKAFAYEHLSRIGKALSSPPRLILLNILVNGPHTVDELARLSELSVANASRHLQVLSRARLVISVRRGRHRQYAIASDVVRSFYLQLRDLGTTSLSELREALGIIASAPTRAEPVGRDELIAAIDRDDTLIIDVRPRAEYQDGHLPGAISIPLGELHHHLDELPQDRELITYCRGRLCVLADAAVTLLHQAGFRARRTDEDIPSWDLAGLPIAQGPAAPPSALASSESASTSAEALL